MAKRKNRKTTKKPLTANKKYKDTVFRMLFSDRKNLLSLYNAINGTGYEDPEELEIVTLENAIYMGMKNYRKYRHRILLYFTTEPKRRKNDGKICCQRRMRIRQESRIWS